MDSVTEHPVLIECGWYLWPTFLVQILVVTMIMCSFFISNMRLEMDWTKIWWRRWLGKTLVDVAWLTFMLAIAWTFVWLILYAATGSQMPVNSEDNFVLLNTVCLGVPALVLFILGREIGRKK
jgi:hypothetical protein